MFVDAMRGRFGTVRQLLLGLSVVFLVLGSVNGARAEPPIKSPQDAYCRNEARNRVFSTPDPQNVGAHEIGRGIYNGCMRQFSRAGRSQMGRRRHHHRGHHHRRHRHRHR